MQIIPDLIIYLALTGLLYWSTRLTRNDRVKISVTGQHLPGPFLRVYPGLLSRVGLLNTPALAEGCGIFLVGAKCVHTVGMSFAIDIIFVDDRCRIIGTVEGALPGVKRLKGPPGTRHVLEMSAGSLEKFAPQAIGKSYLNLHVEADHG